MRLMHYQRLRFIEQTGELVIVQSGSIHPRILRSDILFHSVGQRDKCTVGVPLHYLVRETFSPYCDRRVIRAQARSCLSQSTLASTPRMAKRASCDRNYSVTVNFFWDTSAGWCLPKGF